MVAAPTPDEVSRWPGHRPQGIPVWPTCVHANGFEHAAEIVKGQAVQPCSWARRPGLMKAIEKWEQRDGRP